MVKVRAQRPRFANGGFEPSGWIEEIQKATGWRRVADLQQVLDQLLLHGAGPFVAWDEQLSCAEAGVAIADVLVTLPMDRDSLVAGLIYPLVKQRDECPIAVTASVEALLEGLRRISLIDSLSVVNSKLLASESKEQSENIRRMLVAMVDDVRVPVIKLAERTAAIRSMKDATDLARRPVAHQALDVFAPLAHRLGIGQLRWELEDYAFRYLEPAIYKRIASMLDERREERERSLAAAIVDLERELKRAGIRPRVVGRVKHLYGIWQKMERKQVSFDEIRDVRAVRVLVDEPRDCYAALGMVHMRWRHIPQEFDDYITTPKANGYRSIHTAVLGPGGKVMEVQIRTDEMHREAELGVCAHWSYKDGIPAALDAYHDKLEWLRQLLEGQDEGNVLDAFGEELQQPFAEDRIYVFTPSGDVVDMVKGATAIDFAYRIHTKVGNQCYGARVDGHAIQLNDELHTGQTVEVLTHSAARPRRVWLNDEFGYVRTPRARSKIRAYFRNRRRSSSLEDGRQLFFTELSKLGIWAPLEQLVKALNLASPQDLFVALGQGELDVTVLIHIARTLDPQAAQLNLLPLTDEPARLRGLGHQPFSFASCCNPQPLDDVVGLKRSEGWIVHRRDCEQLERWSNRWEHKPVILEWDNPRASQRFDLTVTALDRSGLLAEVAAILAKHKINVVSNHSAGDVGTGMATIEFRIQARDAEQLAPVIDRIEAIENVLHAECAVVP